LHRAGAGYFADRMTLLATTHSHNLGWGIGFVVVGVLHLAFRGFYSRRSAAIETARQETAPRPLKGRGLYVTGQNANRVWIIGSSVVFLVVGVILIATQI
jgi:predicted aminopeptidase